MSSLSLSFVVQNVLLPKKGREEGRERETTTTVFFFFFFFFFALSSLLFSLRRVFDDGK